MAAGGANGETQQHLIMEASIQGINSAYFVIIIIGVISILLSFFIKHVNQVSEEESNRMLKKQIVTES